MEGQREGSKIQLQFDSKQCPSIPRSSFSNSLSFSSLEEVQLQYASRKKFREHRISKIQEGLENFTSIKVRSSQNIILYFINLVIPIIISCFNAYIFIDLGINSELKGIVMLSLAFIGFVLSFISNIKVAPWRQVVKLYFLFDSITPIIVSAFIGFYSILNFLTTSQWYQTCYYIAFPIWVIYSSGYLRVLIAYSYWSRWQIIVYKIGVLICGLIFFFIGFEYMNGKYKFTKGFLVDKETTLKDLTYLYVFGNVQLFFQFFRKLSQFDQTDDLKDKYCFTDVGDEQNKIIAQTHIKQLRRQALQEELQDLIAARLDHISEVSNSVSKSSM